MSIETNLKHHFKRLVTESCYEKFSITDLCREANVSKSTFYTYFKNKEHLLSSTIYEDILQPVIDIRAILPTKKIENAPQMINERMYQQILDNKLFYQHLASSCNLVLQNTLIQGLAAINHEILRHEMAQDIELDYLAHYFAAAQTMNMIKWIKDGMVVEPDTLARWVYEWGGGYWTQGRQTKKA